MDSTLSSNRISAYASLVGIRELYLIILGIGITEALVNIPTLACNWTFFSYVMLLFAFLSTVFRFALEAMILLEFITTTKAGTWRLSYFVMVLLVLFSALVFFLMGHNLNQFAQFMVYAIILLILDMWLLYVSHRPWEQGGLLHSVCKVLSILTFYCLFPQHHPDRLTDIDAHKRLVYRTHHQWLRSNAYLIILLFALFFYWNTQTLPGVCVLNTPKTIGEWNTWLQYWPQKLWVSQWTLSIVLLIFSMWDLRANYAYYFSGSHPNKNPAL